MVACSEEFPRLIPEKPPPHASRSRMLCIVAAIGLINYLEIGVLKSYGVLVMDLTQGLHASTSLIGTAIGVSHGLSNILSILVPVLMRRFTVRAMVVTGSLVGALGYIATAFVQTGPQFLFVLLVSGLGYSLVIYPPLAWLSKLPGINYSVLCSLAHCGGGVGMMTLPLLTERLKTSYGWRGAVLIIGGLSLNSVVCSSFMPSETVPARTGDSPETTHHAADVNGAAPSTMTQRKEVSKRGGDLTRTTEDSNKFHHIELFREHPLYVLTIMSWCLSGAMYNAWTVFVVPNAVAKGLTMSRGVFLSTVGGSVNITGRLVIGFISKQQLVSDAVLFAVLQVLNAVAFFGNNFASSFVVLILLSMMNGFVVGSVPIMMNYISRAYVRPDLDVVATSYVYLAWGFGEPAGGAVMGYLFDLTESFDLAFLLAGVMSVTAAMMACLPVLHLHRCGKVCGEHGESRRLLMKR